MSATFTEQVTLVKQSCCNCGVMFAMPSSLEDSRRNTGETFYCPNGHPLVFGSRLKELQAELERKQRELVASKCETFNERHKRESVEATLAKHERRIKNGVCPCCKRTFVKLANHIAKAHPNYGPKQERKLP